MKKIVLILAVALTSLCASAQYTVVSNVGFPDDNESWGTENFTNSMGVGYTLNDSYMVGFRKSGDDYDMFVRYSMTDNMYLSADLPSEDTFENARIGVGYSVNFWNDLYVEPNYSVNLDSEDGDKGEFNLGVAYRF
tara:strand:+ start:26 stop:433 length:408 start_codon:yes stop_codon:yes gene_type:complete